MNKENLIPSVNFHLWEPCNMRCKFCFATFQDVKQTILPHGHLQKQEAVEIIELLAGNGFKKITFAGGEPTLCPWLSELIFTAKTNGMTTMIVTNGSMLTDNFLNKNKRYLDWIAVSIDSLNYDTNKAIGRVVNGGKAFNEDYYSNVIIRIKESGYRLKINTTVNRFNFRENMTDFILRSEPERWKVFQVLDIENQNQKTFDRFQISLSEFNYFLKNHSKIKCMVPENNHQMKGSYVMIDPAGRFFNNTSGTYKYSKPILKNGVNPAIKEMNYDFIKFLERKGIYDWEYMPV